jgi:uncharacterized protein (DUF1501 family)
LQRGSYQNPNRSHFESMAIWHTARFDPEERKGYGWLGRALDPLAATSYTIGTSLPGALRGRRSAAVSLGCVEDVLPTEPAAMKQAASTGSADDLLAFVRRQAVDARTAAEHLANLAGRARGPAIQRPASGFFGALVTRQQPPGVARRSGVFLPA